MSSLHESRSRHLQTLSHAVHPWVAQKDENLTAPDQDYREDGGAQSNQIWRLPPGFVDLWEGGRSLHFLSPPLRIQLQLVVCNVCHTQTPISQTTTAALSVGRSCNYTYVCNKHQCCYLSIFTLLSSFWNEKKMWGITFWATLVHFNIILSSITRFSNCSKYIYNATSWRVRILFIPWLPL
jgi:hypothetical protein